MKENRKHRKKRAARRLGARFLLLLVALGILASVGCRIYRHAKTWSVFSIQEIVVRGVEDELVPRVIQASGIKKGASILTLKPPKIAGKLESLDFIRRARIKRRPAGTVILDLTRRTPFALVNGNVIVGEDGREVFTDVNDYGLPHVSCPVKKDESGARCVDPEGLQLAHHVLRTAKSLAVKEIDVSNLNDVQVILEEGTRVRLGVGSYARKSSMAALVMNDLRRTSTQFSGLDARFASQVLVVR